ncbi:jerky protein homolog-like [Trichonephila clavipes]|nr:jerky protein homolog-like [Trichonephila clavipes]
MFQILWSPWTYRCGQRTVRLAVMACSQNQAVFARRRSELKLKLELVEEKQKLLDIRERKENARGARAGSVEESCSRDDIYNVDETGVNWKVLPRKSLTSKGESTTPGFKVSKERVTAVICTKASGTHSLPLLVIGKSKKPRYFKCFMLSYSLQDAKKCVDELCPFSEWYSKDFLPNVKKLREREGKTGKVLLIIDNAPCHPPVEILNAIDDDFSVLYLPPNVTALVQPMDQGVIKKFKKIYS